MTVHRSLVLALVAISGLPSLATAVTVSVGTGAGCTYPTLQAAFDALDDQAGSHVIRLRRETFAIPAGASYAPTVAQPGVFIEGGYVECGDAAPGTGINDTSTIDAAGGAQAPALRLLIDGRVGTVQIRRTTIRGGDALSTTTAWNGAGGGIAIRGPASVLLGARAVVSNNQAVRGGGIALIGGLISGTVPDKVDLYLDEGASVSSNAASAEGGGIYCGGNSVSSGPTFGARHGSIIAIDTTIAFNSAGGLGGAFACSGTVEGGGGFQPRPRANAAVLILGNSTTGGGGCAAGAGTLDTTIPQGSDGFRPLGAADGENGLLAIANNTGSRPGMCLSSSRSIGTDNYPNGPSAFKLQNLVVTGQNGSGTLGISVTREEMRLRIQPSGRNVACTFFEPTPCVSFTANEASGSAGTGSVTPLVDNLGTLELVRASIRDNVTRNALIRNYSGSNFVTSSLIVGNRVESSASDPTRSAFEVGGNLLMGTLTARHNTVVFSTPLDRFVNLAYATSQASVRANIFASSASPAPANFGGLAPNVNFRREWCGFFQRTDDFATHTVVNDPTSGTFQVLSPASYSLEPGTFAPGDGLVDWCTKSVADDFYGAPFGSVALYPGAGPADIGAVENRSDVIFADGFER
ncbi:MAG: hypothetical protein J0L88_00985 [Xanthomonadales bacterium]|nr:hypothetical protein [Xanthomonadales bacterium]